MDEAGREKIEDRQAIEACQKGDRDAFEALVRRYAARATGVARSILKDAALAEDAAQEAFVRAFRAIRKFDLEQPFYPWFYRILKNVCLTKLKRRRVTVFSLDAEDAPPVEAPPDDPSKRASRKELRVTILAAMDTLSDAHREILHLAHFEHLAYKEMAACLGIPVGTVMSRLFAARKKLKEALEPVLQPDE